MRVEIIILIILGVTLLLLFIVTLYCYFATFYRNKNKIQDVYSLPDKDLYLPYKPKLDELYYTLLDIKHEDILITSFDNTKLSAKYYHNSDEKIIQIMFHGYKGSGVVDFCGGHKLARDINHNILLIDQRGAGKSNTHTITFGIKERFDCLEWINYCINRFGDDVKIILVGVSMGASTVLMASELNLPNNVIGIVADSPFTSPKDIISKVIKDMKLSPKLVYPFIKLSARIFGHFKLEETDSIKAVKNSKVPILIIHGERDSFVPCHMSKQIAENANGNVEFHSFEGAGHGFSFMTNPDRYIKITNEFYEKCLKKGPKN